MRARTLSALLGLATLSAAPLAAATLYMSDDQNRAICTVDVATTGAATLVGSTGLSMSFSGLAWDSSTGLLYISDVVNTDVGDSPGPVEDGRNLPQAVGPARFGFGLGAVNPTTGAITYIGDHLNSYNIHGLAYDSANDVLWGADIDSGGGLAVIDRSTGVSTFVGTLPADWVEIPTLGAWSLALLAAALGAAALLVLRRSA